MVPWVHLDSAKIPSGGDLRLMQRGTEFSIMLGGNELMNSRLSGSEEALARLSCERIATRSKPRILIGGLGMGFTLRAALAHARADAEIIVAELVPEVVAWARGPLASLYAGSLDDPRLRVEQGDVGRFIAAERAGFDAILLDVDNGPDGLTSSVNDGLYDSEGLRSARSALRRGGILAVWSAAPDERFGARLRRSGFAVEEVKVRAGSSPRGARHVIWLATKPSKL